jgi:2-dehydro-3-deoxygluconokinase
MSMPQLTIKATERCLWDLVSLGEIMLRLDPGDGRVATTRSFAAWEGGGEYNVARGLKRCFGLRTAVVSAFADNQVGRLIQDLIYQGGVDQSYVKWVKYDGVGRSVRNGLNFTERGFGVRAAAGCSDRGHTAASQLRPGDIDWNRIFGQDGVRWFHTGGIFAALSESTPLVAKEAMEAAKRHGTIVSYDLNYRESLWKGIGGQAKAREVNRELARYVDVMIGNEEDFTASLGFEVEGVDESFSSLDPTHFKKMIQLARQQYPNFQVVATTLRNARTASINDWGAVCSFGDEFYLASLRENLEIYDRVGGGDSFASGLVYGFLSGQGPQFRRRLRRRPRRPGDDHPGRHQHGDARRGAEGHEGRQRPGFALRTHRIMEKAEVLRRIRQVGLIPILRTPSADDALLMAETLQAAQLSNLEIPLTVPGAVEVIGELVARFGANMLIGAGTVLDARGPKACVEAGATFIGEPRLRSRDHRLLPQGGACRVPGRPRPPTEFGSPSGRRARTW